MRHFFSFLILGFLLSSTCWAQQGGNFRDQDDSRGRRRPPNMIFEAIDSDGNQVIDKRELRKALAALKSLDADGDGNITLEEVTPRRPGGPDDPNGSRGPGGGRDQSRFVDRIMAQNDKNGDDKLSPDEVSDRLKDMLKGGDTSGDGMIDREELAAVLAQNGGRPGGRFGGLRGDDAQEIAQQLMSNDKNGDGMLEPSELPPETLQMLKGADMDGDKHLNRKEVMAAAEKIADRNSRRRGRGTGGRFGPGGPGGPEAGPEGEAQVPDPGRFSESGPPRPGRKPKN